MTHAKTSTTFSLPGSSQAGEILQRTTTDSTTTMTAGPPKIVPGIRFRTQESVPQGRNALFKKLFEVDVPDQQRLNSSSPPTVERSQQQETVVPAHSLQSSPQAPAPPVQAGEGRTLSRLSQQSRRRHSECLLLPIEPRSRRPASHRPATYRGCL